MGEWVLSVTANGTLMEAGKENILAWEVKRPERLQHGLFCLHKLSFHPSPCRLMPPKPAPSVLCWLDPWESVMVRDKLQVTHEKDLYINCFNITETPQKCDWLGLEHMEGRDCVTASEPNTKYYKWLMLSKFPAAKKKKKREKVPWESGGENSLPHRGDSGAVLKNVLGSIRSKF